MAINKLRISTSVLPIYVGDDVVTGGQTYTEKEVDKNIERNFGGKYNTLEYTDEDIVRWSNAIVVAHSSALPLNNSAWALPASGEWELPTNVSAGAIPTTARVVAIEFTKAIGTATMISLTIGSTVFATLSVGEGIVIPIQAGVSASSILIQVNNYLVDVNEATVNVMLAGV